MTDAQRIVKDIWRIKIQDAPHLINPDNPYLFGAKNLEKAIGHGTAVDLERQLVRLESTLKVNIEWKESLPDEEGWYWFLPPLSEPEVVYVGIGSFQQVGSDKWVPIEKNLGKWAGPLKTPTG